MITQLTSEQNNLRFKVPATLRWLEAVATKHKLRCTFGNSRVDNPNWLWLAIRGFRHTLSSLSVAFKGLVSDRLLQPLQCGMSVTIHHFRPRRH